MKGITTILVLCVAFMATMLSPMKMSFLLVLISAWASLTSYTLTSSVFPACAVLISFSTGMMVLFCYCSTLSEHETKTSLVKKLPTWAIVGSLLLTNLWESECSSSLKKCMIEMSTPTLTLMMGVILCSMISINVTLIDPSKPLMSSY